MRCRFSSLCRSRSPGAFDGLDFNKFSPAALDHYRASPAKRGSPRLETGRSRVAETSGRKFLLRAQERETQQEKRGQDPDEGTDLPNLSGADLDEGERKQSQAQSRGDT